MPPQKRQNCADTGIFFVLRKAQSFLNRTLRADLRWTPTSVADCWPGGDATLKTESADVFYDNCGPKPVNFGKFARSRHQG